MPFRYVTPTLYVTDDGGPVPELIDGPVPTLVFGWAAAYRVLRRRGLSPDEARHRINFARTGDMYATRTAARRRQQRSALHGH